MKINISRFWKKTQNTSEALVESPISALELTDEELASVDGACGGFGGYGYGNSFLNYGNCNGGFGGYGYGGGFGGYGYGGGFGGYGCGVGYGTGFGGYGFRGGC